LGNLVNRKNCSIIRSDDLNLSSLNHSVPVKILDYLRSSRILTGIILLVSSIVIANTFLKASGKVDYVWRTTTPLAPGSVISESDLKPAAVSMREQLSSYISTKQTIIGTMVVREVGENELLPINAISNDEFALKFRDVPLTLEITDIPLDLSRGQIVDIYSLPNRETKTFKNIEPVISQISVVQVSDRNNSLKAQVLVAVPIEHVEIVLQHLADARILIVRSDH
jgi:flagella basal body P-ring formation protein FlgA